MNSLSDAALLPLPDSTIPSLNSTPRGSTTNVPQVPVHPPLGVAPLPRFRSERLLPAPNMVHPLPPTFTHAQKPMVHKFSSKGTTSKGGANHITKIRNSPDRFIPASTSVNAFYMSSPAHLLSQDEKLLRRSDSRNSPFLNRDRSLSPSSETRGSNPVVHRGLSSGNGISAAGRAIYIGAGSSRGTEINININSEKERPEIERERHESRLAAALGVDRCARVMSFIKQLRAPGIPRGIDTWDELYSMENKNDASRSSSLNATGPTSSVVRSVIPTTPFRVLDAPGLRDDYYCSLLAYSPQSHSLSVGLHADVYLWTEAAGAAPLEQWSTSHVTCLAFSSTVGKRNILAIGRIDGNLCLWKPGELRPRVERIHTAGVACVSWRPVLQKRWDASFSIVNEEDLPRLSSPRVDCEDLLVGDEMGVVYYYSLLWDDKHTPEPPERKVEAGGAKLKLVRKIVAHTQQICGLCWSPDGDQFVTGGNDNVACLFNAEDVFAPRVPSSGESKEAQNRREKGRYRWAHGAAVKAMAFCPWQRRLLATGGGSNDRCIHFYHTFSGACLATINVSAQVTSLLWSNHRREIAATFGYANPEHAIRIAVFSWPECKQIAAIPWGEDMRALYAVAYPGGPIDELRDSDSKIDELGEEGGDTEEDLTNVQEIERVVAIRGRSHEQTGPVRPRVETDIEISNRIEASTGNAELLEEAQRGRAQALSLLAALGTSISTPISAHNTSSRSRSRGRPADREYPQPIRPGTRNPASVAQAASLRRRKTRSGKDGNSKFRSADGCIVVAASDETVRFHEVWSEGRKGIIGWRGVLGGSDILEGLEGIEKDGGETIR